MFENGSFLRRRKRFKIANSFAKVDFPENFKIQQKIGQETHYLHYENEPHFGDTSFDYSNLMMKPDQFSPQYLPTSLQFSESFGVNQNFAPPNFSPVYTECGKSTKKLKFSIDSILMSD